MDRRFRPDPSGDHVDRVSVLCFRRSDWSLLCPRTL